MCLDKSLSRFNWSWKTSAWNKISSKQVTCISTRSCKGICVFLGLFWAVGFKRNFQENKYEFQKYEGTFSKNITRTKNLFHISPRCYQFQDWKFPLRPIFKNHNFPMLHNVVQRNFWIVRSRISKVGNIVGGIIKLEDMD